jgi:hypothetical protein
MSATVVIENIPAVSPLAIFNGRTGTIVDHGYRIVSVRLDVPATPDEMATAEITDPNVIVVWEHKAVALNPPA